MKLRNADVIKKSGKVQYKGVWTDQMRRPAAVKVILDKGPDKPVDSQVWLEGNEYDTHHFLETCAEVAWNGGWRPKGMLNAVAGLIQGFQVVKDK